MSTIVVGSKQRFSIGTKKSIVLLILYVLMTGYFLRTYLSWQSVNCLMGLMALLVVIQPNKRYKGSRRFGYWVIFFSIAALLIQVKTLLFFALIAGIFFAIEQEIGKVDRLSMVLILFICPFFQYSVNVFSFPIRLWLTQMAGKILNSIGVATTVNGSVIVCRGQDFLVDTACMGLKMLVTSLLLSVSILSLLEKKNATKVRWKSVFLFLLFVLIFNIIANLLRIVLIVQFAILPSSIFHDIIGMICFIIYVVLPTWYTAKAIIKKSHPNYQLQSPKSIKAPVSSYFQGAMLALLLLSSFTVENRAKVNLQHNDSVVAIPGYKCESLPHHTIKIESEHSLIYLKRIEDFFTADHNPMICWRGSGFELSEVHEEMISSKRVYMASLRKGAETLYTAWWFDNGKKQTIGQIEFRLDMLRGAPDYTLVNVTCASKDYVITEIEQIFEKALLNKSLQ